MKRIIPRWLKENFWIKAGMLVLAVLLWFLVVTEKAFEDTFSIPIIVTGLPPGKTPTTGIPATALIRFHGRAKELIRLRYVSPPHLNIDLSNVSERRIIRLKPESIIFPGGMNVTVVEIIHPDSIVTAVEEYSETFRPVKLVANLKYAPGYTLFGDPVISPAKVTLSGPHNEIDVTKEVPTERLVLTDLSRTTEVLIPLSIPPAKGLKVQPDKVSLILHVERIGERVITDIPVMVERPPANGTVHLEPTQVKVTLRGAVSLLAGLAVSDIKCSVNYAEIESSHPGRLPVHVVVPKGVDLAGIDPMQIRGTLRK